MQFSSSLPKLVAGVLATSIVVAVACDSSIDSATAPSVHSQMRHTGAATRSPADPRLLAEIRAATARYHDVAAARADGFVDDGFGCISDPVLGGMGWHLINDALHADPATDPLRPDLLVYEPGPNGQLRLVALEYEVYQRDWYAAGNTEPPTLLGQQFESIDFPPLPLIFGLHVWLFKNNPAGTFADFNPNVRCP
jgi:hypothetical protein